MLNGHTTHGCSTSLAWHSGSLMCFRLLCGAGVSQSPGNKNWRAYRRMSCLRSCSRKVSCLAIQVCWGVPGNRVFVNSGSKHFRHQPTKTTQPYHLLRGASLCSFILMVVRFSETPSTAYGRFLRHLPTTPIFWFCPSWQSSWKQNLWRVC